MTLKQLFKDVKPNINTIVKVGPFCDLLSLVCEEYVLADNVSTLTKEERYEIALWASVCHVAAGIDDPPLARPEEPKALAKVLLRPGQRVVVEGYGSGVVESYYWNLNATGPFDYKKPFVKLDDGGVVVPLKNEIVGVGDPVLVSCQSCDDGAALKGSQVNMCKDCGRERPGELPQYPELDKMKAVRSQSQVLTEFVDWLDQNNMRICLRTETAVTYRGSPYEPITENYEQLFARYFEIDLNKVEAERQQLLDLQRKLNEQADNGQ